MHRWHQLRWPVMFHIGLNYMMFYENLRCDIARHCRLHLQLPKRPFPAKNSCHVSSSDKANTVCKYRFRLWNLHHDTVTPWINVGMRLVSHPWARVALSGWTSGRHHQTRRTKTVDITEDDSLLLVQHIAKMSSCWEVSLSSYSFDICSFTSASMHMSSLKSG